MSHANAKDDFLNYTLGFLSNILKYDFGYKKYTHCLLFDSLSVCIISSLEEERG